jgi:hypothetical protein
MHFFIPLFLAAALSLPSVALGSTSTVGDSSGGTKWALLGGKHTAKAAKAPKAKKTHTKAPRSNSAHRAKSSH